MNLNAVYVESVIALKKLRGKSTESWERFQDTDITGKLHHLKSRARHTLDVVKGKFVTKISEDGKISGDISHVFRRKSWWELVLLSGAVCGIEFCYAAETAFVTPTLLSLGLDVQFMTMIWCISPLIGFFLTPLLGSLSDSCQSPMGRRRPFIIVLSIGVLLGLILVPNGHAIGLAIGDESSQYSSIIKNEHNSGSKHREISTYPPTSSSHSSNFALNFDLALYTSASLNNSEYIPIKNHSSTETDLKHTSQKWSIVFTVLGTVLLDLCSDACQSPARTYLLDVTVPEDHATGLSTFTIMAGFGGAIGYLMGAINWETTFIGYVLGGHVRAVFTIVTILFIVCLLSTITSFPEVPLYILRDPSLMQQQKGNSKQSVGKYHKFTNIEEEEEVEETKILQTYGTMEEPIIDNDCIGKDDMQLRNFPDDMNPTTMGGYAASNTCASTIEEVNIMCTQPTLKEYLISIIQMPKSLRILCLTNLFCWMSLVCYSLYFTDFVGESVYHGDPQAAEESEAHHLYEEGIRFGCWGMALYSISCSLYSYCIEHLVHRLGAKTVYIGGQVVYSIGMILMAALRHPVAVIVLSPTAGIMYATLFTMPYLLIAHYHCMQMFEEDNVSSKFDWGLRGIGTDVATVSSMVFLSQFVLSLSMGSIVSFIGSSVVTVCAAAILSACGAISATQVFYLDL